MPNPQNATLYAVRGQAFNLTMRVVSLTTGNPITGGLHNLAVWVSKDDGGFTPAATAPTELVMTGTGSGFVSVDLTAAEMSYTKIDVQLTCSDANAVFDAKAISTADLRPETMLHDEEPIVRLERLWLNLFSYWFNYQYNATGSGAKQRVANRLGAIFANAIIRRGDVDSERRRFLSGGG